MAGTLLISQVGIGRATRGLELPIEDTGAHPAITAPDVVENTALIERETRV